VIKISVVVEGFGSGDKPPCPKCTAPTRLTGRETHPEFSAKYELQTFECGQCGHIHTRSADGEGNPSPQE
jgi:hypothetical protein